MAGATVTIRDEEVRKLLGDLARKAKDAAPVMRIIGSIIRTSVVRNFEEEGRPKWPELKNSTAKIRGAQGPILRRQGFAGGLLGSINIEAGSDQVSVGTNKVYAAVHQFGARKGSFGRKRATVKRHTRKSSRGRRYEVQAHTREVSLPWGDIPARPFLKLQEPEDVNEIKAAIADYLGVK